jgi:hypothetical protein
MNRTQIRRLARLVQRASAALTPLAEGLTHDGRPLPGQERTLRQAIDAIRCQPRRRIGNTRPLS